MFPDSTMLLASSGNDISLGIALIIGLGVAGQWIAARLRIPSVLVLLSSGIVVGPVLGIVDPAEDIGPALFPAVSLAVGLLLFEGGLGLKLDRLQQGRQVVIRLVTLGALVTWIIGSFTISLLFDVTNTEAGLIGAILVVSGPTVVIPLLQLAHPREPSASILRWEGIVIDPIGATLAIVMLDTLVNPSEPVQAAIDIAITLVAGTAVGVAGAGLALVGLHRHLIPDRLHNPMLLAIAIAAFAIANAIAPEAGLMATTAMGLTLANQHRVPAEEITTFSEDLGYIILGTLFITLGALVDLDAIVDVLPRVLILLAVLVFVARPATVFLSTLGTDVPGPDRRFMSWMAPRGIVAAAVATVFSTDIEEQTGEPLEELVPIVFAIVILTVALYGLTAVTAARRTRVAKARPVGLAIVSNHPVGMELADLLARNDVTVLLVAPDRRSQRQALERGILVYSSPLSDENLPLALEGLGIAEAVLITDDANLASLASYHLINHLGRANVHHVGGDGPDLQLRNAFGAETFDSLTDGTAVLDVLPAHELTDLHTPLLVLGDAAATVVDSQRPSDGLVLAAFRGDRPPGT